MINPGEDCMYLYILFILQSLLCLTPLVLGTSADSSIRCDSDDDCVPPAVCESGTCKPEFTVRPVGTGAVGAVAGAAVIVLVVVFLCCRRQTSEREDHSHDDAEETVQMQDFRRTVKLKEFAEHLGTLHKDSNLRFDEEFQDITRKSPTFAQTAAVLDINKIKNRFVNVLPFDFSRVKLRTNRGDGSTDYVNASYIPGYSSQMEYIATQGPMTATVNDFWRMMWEQKSCLIVQLADRTQKGQSRVDPYWPHDPNIPVQFGDIIISLISTSTFEQYTVRNFTICLEGRMEQKRCVAQYCFHGFVDYRQSPEDMLDFIRAVRLEARKNPSRLITVHCSAGVGRTGTFIALDYLQQFVDDHTLDDVVDIYNLVLNLRHHRPFMVQSEAQYVFIYDATMVIVDRKIRSLKPKNENIYHDIGVDGN